MPETRRPGKRAAQAQETRRRILEAARDMFVADGYGATNLQDVAARAGVAIQTIYYVFGTKRNLLKVLVDVTIAGDDQPLATMERPWFTAAMATATAGEHLRAHVSGTRPILERVAPIARVLDGAVAADPEISVLWPQDTDPRHTVQSAAARALMAKPGARPDVSPEHAADLLYGLLSPEVFTLFVERRNWSPDAWERWAHDTLRHQLTTGT
ncbi:TetR/AcrR family transcriptional regulator [Actinomadura rugatobispora]|uniref:TetR/AcrR family transcriptional regulator n=1 Tax=Actinomadura rugatobispora TaxID=1994 RepID=A0ABW1AK68_9ACTN|nr:TetR/AcrR family transcriptional regulator [Actinomadura rugatobispora]